MTPAHVNAEGIDLLSLDHRPPRRFGVDRHEQLGIVGGVQFAAERNIPALFSTEPRRRAAHGLDNREVRLRRELGHSQVVIAQKLASRRRARTSGVFACPSSSSALVNPNRQRTADVSRPAVRAQPDAAMDGKYRETIVESRDLVDVRAIEEVRTPARPAVRRWGEACCRRRTC